MNGFGIRTFENRVDELLSDQRMPGFITTGSPSTYPMRSQPVSIRVSILHLLGDQVISQQASEYSQCGVQRIQAGADFHASPPCPRCLCRSRKDQSAFFQCGSSVRESVLDNQVLRIPLRLRTEPHRCLLEVITGSSILHAVLFAGSASYGSRRSWSDLVDHGPGEGNLIRRIRHIIIRSLFPRVHCLSATAFANAVRMEFVQFALRCESSCPC